MDEEVVNVESSEQVEQPQVDTQEVETSAQVEQEIQDWTQDKRANSMWKNDPNQLYGSYKNMEKMYTPLKTQQEQLNKMFKTYGVEPTKVEDVLKEYQTYKDPNAPQNQWLNYLGQHLNGDTKDDVVKFFNELDRKMDQKKYGENLPDEVIEKLKKADQLEERFNAKERSEQEAQQYQQTIKTIESKLGEVETIAKEYDVVWDEDTKNGFLKYCSDNDIPPQYMHMAFSQLALNAVKKSASVQSQRSVVKNMESNKKAGITTKSVNTPKKDVNQSFRDAIATKLGFDN